MFKDAHYENNIWNKACFFVFLHLYLFLILEYILDEAKTSVEVVYLKNIPMPVELKVFICKYICFGCSDAE